MLPKKQIQQDEKTAIALCQLQMQKARQTPWFASLMLKKAKQQQEQLSTFFQWLANLPRHWQQLIRRSLAASIVGAALLLTWNPTPSVHAANITVTPGAAGINGSDGCSLVEAIINANANSATHAECISGSGADIITMANGTYAYTGTHGTNSALPDIISNITIEANGATIERDFGSSFFRLIQVNSGGTLVLNDATIAGGDGYGGIHNQGNLTINNSIIINNTTVNNNGGGIFNNAGNTDATVTINNSTISGNTAYTGGNSPILGGGIANITTGSGDALLTIYNSTITGNFVKGYGGGIANQSTSSGSAQATINDTTIVNNSAGRFGTPFSGGPGKGGGLYNAANNSTIDLNRTIVSGNGNSYPTGTPSRSYEVYDSSVGGVTGNNYNLFGQSTSPNAYSFIGFTPSGSDITATSDGNEPTILRNIFKRGLRDRGTLSHRLTAGSPAIDAVPCTPGASSDQHGGERGNGAGSGGSACDIGAVEYDSNTGVIITVDASAAGINSDGDCSLIEAIHNANDDWVTHADCTTGEADDTIILAGNLYGYINNLNGVALPEITSDLTIEGNGATIAKTGGLDFGIFSVLENGELTLNDTTVTDGDKHGIVSVNGGINLNNSAVTNNSATGFGGGIHIVGDLPAGGGSIAPEFGSSGELNLYNTIISGNSTNGEGGGGGIWAERAHIQLDNVTLNDNDALSDFSGGGAIALYGVFGEINNSTISGNSAGPFGGGAIRTVIFRQEPARSLISLNHVTITGNTATGVSGGLSISVGDFHINNSILSGNTGTGNGKEFYHVSITACYSGCSPTHPNVYIDSSILGHDQLTNIEAVHKKLSGGSLTITNSYWATSSGGSPVALSAIIDTNLADNGGTTQTHALVNSSPAIDLIPTTDAACDPGVSTDQRSAVRAGGVDRGGSACDAGAFEYASDETPTAVSLQSFSAETTPTQAGFFAVLLAGITAVTVGLWRRMRKEHE